MSAKYDFTIEQGVTFRKKVVWKDEAGNPVNLTGKTGRLEVRSREGTLIKALTVAIVNAAQGEFALSLTDAETKALDFDTAVYDFEISSAGEVEKRLLQGIVTLDREATKDAT